MKNSNQQAAQAARMHSDIVAPVHVRYPAALGIDDIMKPDFGDAVTIKEGEPPVFWTYSVTPQAVLMATKLPFAITHAPGHMFITDVADSNYRV